MLPVHSVVKEVRAYIEGVETQRTTAGKLPGYTKIYPDAMVMLHRQWQTLQYILKTKPNALDERGMEALLRLAGEAIKTVADLGDPRVVRSVFQTVAADIQTSNNRGERCALLPAFEKDPDPVDDCWQPRPARTPADQAELKSPRPGRKKSRTSSRFGSMGA